MNVRERLDYAVVVHVKTHRAVINVNALLDMNYLPTNKAVKVSTKKTR